MLLKVLLHSGVVGAVVGVVVVGVHCDDYFHTDVDVVDAVAVDVVDSFDTSMPNKGSEWSVKWGLSGEPNGG